MCKGPEAIKSRAPLEKHRVWGECRVPGESGRQGTEAMSRGQRPGSSVPSACIWLRYILQALGSSGKESNIINCAYREGAASHMEMNGRVTRRVRKVSLGVVCWMQTSSAACQN